MNLDDWLSRIEQLHPKSWDLGLERVGEVGRRLDVLKPAKTVFLVAGTNGKGTTCEAIAGLCRRRGLRVGKSTSPHLVSFNERIVVDGEPASDEAICGAFAAIEAARGDISLSYFEFGALAAMLLFREASVDVAVLEIGLGGRLDAMNIVDPDVSVITRIALDHQDWLGDTREVIAVEKAGVMRPGKPCVIADSDPPGSLLEAAERTGSEPRVIGRDFDRLEGDCRLPGESLAAAMEAIAAAGMEPDPGDMAFLRSLELPGRFQRIDGPVPTLLDVAHNPDAATWLARRLKSVTRKRCHAVFGVYGDKDYQAVIQVLAPSVDVWYPTTSGEPRSLDPSDLADALASFGEAIAGKYDKVSSAYDEALKNCEMGDLILVFGSFPVVGGVLDHLANRPQLSPDD